MEALKKLEAEKKRLTKKLYTTSDHHTSILNDVDTVAKLDAAIAKLKDTKVFPPLKKKADDEED